MTPLKITTCQAENTFEITRRLAVYLAARLGTAVTCIEDIEWPERYRLLGRSEIEIGWICGLPYVQRPKQAAPGWELLAAPVMQGERYGARPCYFSDVVVRADSPWQHFADLHGVAWAYNEPGSHSGYNIVRYKLAEMGADGRFFGRLLASGAHMQSLAMILRGQVNAAAIDSTVLEWALQIRPHIHQQIRIIDTLGPSPSPPLVIQARLPPEVKADIRQLVCQMHMDVEGRDVLASGGLTGFTAVSDQDYDPIREMAKRSASVSFPRRNVLWDM